MFLSLIVPTLREADNLRKLVPEICGLLQPLLPSDFEILVVDDDSRDGTEELLAGMARDGLPVRCVIRKGERGLSSAVIRGFREAGSECFIVMDADLSHPPELLPRIVEGLKAGRDLVLPSRYRRGGGAEQWPWTRRMISLGATLPARLLVPVSDPMSGYFGLRRSVVESAEMDPIGYKILLEILVKGRYDRKNTMEIPYVFRNRHLGTSKLNVSISREYLVHWFRLLAYKFSRGSKRGKS